jgi:hypothetical protein
MKWLLLMFLLLPNSIIFGQAYRTTKLLTSKYAGNYTYGKESNLDRTGSILIYPETDSTLQFFIHLNLGHPSFNVGSLYGTAILKNNSWIFNTKFEYADKGCTWRIIFNNNQLTIQTIDFQNECGFGGGLFGDGIFKRRSKYTKNNFVDFEGQKVYFDKTKPADYYKN